jgi:hypothetical protein
MDVIHDNKLEVQMSKETLQHWCILDLSFWVSCKLLKKQVEGLVKVNFAM